MNTLTIDELQERITSAVLATLDKEVKELLGDSAARGWIDKELPVLFRGLYPHVKAIALRINEGGEPGSAGLKIDMGEATDAEWQPLRAAGQIHAGDRLRFNVGDRKIEASAKLILHQGTDLEEVVYDRKNNFYFITSMALEGTSSHKGVEFCPAAA